MFIDFSPLRQRNYRNLFLSQLVSSFGSQMTAVAIPFQVYQLTHSTFYTGLISGFELVFLLGASMLGGFLADSRDRRRVLMGSEFFLSLGVLGMALNAQQATPSMATIFVLTALVSSLNGLHRPSLEAMTQRLVPRDQLIKVSALNPLRNILTTILGPTIAGVCMAHYGAQVAYFVDASSFALSLLFLTRLPAMPPLADADVPLSFFASFKEGARYVVQHEEIIGTYVVDFFAMVFCMPQVLFPALAEYYAHPEAVGVLYAAPSVGALAASLFSGWTQRVRYQGRAIVFAAALWAVSMSFTGFAPNLTCVLIGLFMAGFCDMISGIFRNTLWNETIPPGIRGRMAGFEMLGYMTGPLLGNTWGGFMADRFGVHRTLAFGGMLGVCAIGGASLRLRRFWHFSRRALVG